MSNKKGDLGFIKPEEELQKKIVNIIDNKTQYLIRIPMELVRAMKLNTKKDKFEFTLIIPADKKDKPRLECKLIKR